MLFASIIVFVNVFGGVFSVSAFHAGASAAEGFYDKYSQSRLPRLEPHEYFETTWLYDRHMLLIPSRIGLSTYSSRVYLSLTSMELPLFPCCSLATSLGRPLVQRETGMQSGVHSA